MLRRIRQVEARGKIIRLLEGVTRPRPNAVGPKTFERQLRPFRLRVDVLKSAALENDQVVHAIVKSGNGRTEIAPDLLLVDEFV